MSSTTTLVSFNSANGAYPIGSLIADANGNLFGTTEVGGVYGYGTVFEIPYTDGSYASTPTTLVSFNGTNGTHPYDSLIADANGDLFGTTAGGGSVGNGGTVFEIPYTDGSYASTPTTLVSFSSTVGVTPEGALITDANGDLFGTTSSGGAYRYGTVFEIPYTDGSYASTPITLISFNSTNGATPVGSLITDANGDLFGTTYQGGDDNDGVVFEIPYADGSYASTPTTLVSFNGANGAHLYGSLIADANGDLFGTTRSGGDYNDGTVFELAPNGDGTYTTTTLVSFNGTNGRLPYDSLNIDADGNLFGTTAFGGASNDGTVFELAPNGDGTYTTTTVVSFNGTNGDDPHGSLIADSDGDLYGTTEYGGTSGYGNVFEVTDSGYVPCFTTGTRIRTPMGDVAVEALCAGDMVATQKNSDIVFRPVKWIGRRRIDLSAHPRMETVAPVCILRGAFADNVPHRDLAVSPDHAILVEGRLICAHQLINGTTIRQEQGLSAVEYFHVELDAHSILLAEGLPTESYLDTGNRGFFANADEPLMLHPNLTDETGRSTREAASCAPFVCDEVNVRPVWERLAKRAAYLDLAIRPVQTMTDPDLRIVAKGRTLNPISAKDGLYCFVLPGGETEVRLISRAGSPTEARPWAEDRRYLGVNVERIVFRSGDGVQETPVDHPALSQGWWAPEGTGMTLRRWTNGDAVLTLPAIDGPMMLEVCASNGGIVYLTDSNPQRRAA